MCSNPCESEVTCFRPESNRGPYGLLTFLSAALSTTELWWQLNHRKSFRNLYIKGCCRVWSFFIGLLFLVNSHFGHSRAWILAGLPTAALLHRCFPSNLSTTTQGGIVKLRGTSSKWCTLLYWSVWNRKTTSVQDAWSTNCSGVCWEEGMGGWGVLVSQEVGTMKS